MTAISQDLTFIDKTTNRCYEGYNITLRCESAISGRLSIISPNDGQIANPDCSLADSSETRYVILACDVGKFIEFTITGTSWEKDGGQWECDYGLGEDEVYLEVFPGNIHYMVLLAFQKANF